MMHMDIKMPFLTLNLSPLLLAIQTASSRLEWQTNQILQFQNIVLLITFIALPLATHTFNRFPRELVNKNEI